MTKDGLSAITEAAYNKKPEYLQYIDIERLNYLMTKITEATGMGIAACDYTGVPVAGAVGYCEFCRCVQTNKEGKRVCEASTAIGEIQSATTHKPYIYVCPHGLMEVSIPINVDGKFMGGIVAGQILCHDIPEYVTRVASIFPAEVICTDKYSEEMKKCTSMTFEEFSATAQMVYAMLTELFNAKVNIEVDSGEIADVINENEKLKNSIQKLETARLKCLVKTKFLLGALSSIANKAAIEGAIETNEMVGILSELIEDLIVQTDTDSFLCDEMRIIERYLILQQQKIDDLEFEIRIPEEVKLYRVPTMLIYQIIEYSVNCGLLYKENVKKLLIEVTEDEEFLNISVSDNGLGMKFNEVKAMYPQIMEEYSILGDKNNGIQMLKERIKLLFGDECKLSISMHRGKGTYFMLSLPISFAKGDE